MRAEAGEHDLGLVVVDERLEVSSASGAAGTPSAVLIGSDGRIAGPLASGATAVAELVESAVAGGSRPRQKAERVKEVFRENNERLRDLLAAAIPRTGPQPEDVCATALRAARL